MSVTFAAEIVSPDGRNITEVPGSPEVNLANGNAATVLQALGLAERSDPDRDACGSVPAEEFAQRLAIAELADPGVGRATQVHPLGGGSTLTAVGTDPGYLARRFADLDAVARAAAAAGGNVGWG